MIDLAGDFRLPARRIPDWYGFEHPSADWLGKAVYGLPELFGDQLPGAQLVANPGCFPTPVILGLAPLLSAGLVEPGPILVDGKTGLSGAGRAASEASLFAAVRGERPPVPRAAASAHARRWSAGLELATGFTPGGDLRAAPRAGGPRRRHDGVRAARRRGRRTEELTSCLADAYAGRPFVRVLPPGGMVDSKRTRGSNVVELQAVADTRTGTAVVIGALDNLVKGAAGQAIQNLNLMLGLDEATALPTIGGVPVSVTYPLGFMAAGMSAGLKPSGRPDLGLLVGDPGDDRRGSLHDEPRRRRARAPHAARRSPTVTAGPSS